MFATAFKVIRDSSAPKSLQNLQAALNLQILQAVGIHQLQFATFQANRGCCRLEVLNCCGISLAQCVSGT